MLSHTPRTDTVTQRKVLPVSADSIRFTVTGSVCPVCVRRRQHPVREVQYQIDCHYDAIECFMCRVCMWRQDASLEKARLYMADRRFLFCLQLSKG